MSRFFIFLFILMIAVAACNKPDVSIENSNQASVSIYAVVPGAPDFNFFLNENNIAAQVPFGSYTLYSQVAPVDVAFRAQSISRDINIETKFRVAAKEYYSLFLTDNLSGIKTVVLHDALPAPVLDSCSVRFFVLSPGVTGCDFHMVKTDSTKATVLNWPNRGFGDDITADSINVFKKLAAGTYSFYAISRANSKDTLARFTNKTFGDSTNYTLMLEGRFAAGDTSLMLGNRVH